MEPNLTPAERQNDEGACWTCLDKSMQCDGQLPRMYSQPPFMLSANLIKCSLFLVRL